MLNYNSAKVKIKKTLVRNIVYIIVVSIYCIYLTLIKFNSPIVPMIELIIHGENIQGQKGQLYCRTENNKYSWKRSVDFIYNKDLLVAEDTYKIRIVLPCSSMVSRIRFDPIPNVGIVTIEALKIHSNIWESIDLDKILKQSKPLSNIANLSKNKKGILIETRGKDPYIELTEQLQSYLTPEISNYVSLFFKYFFNTFLALKLVLFLGLHLLNFGPTIVKKLKDLKQLVDSGIGKFIGRISSFFIKDVLINKVVFIIGFVFFLIGNIIYFKHLFEFISFENSLIFVSLVILFILPLLVYTFFLRLAHQRLFFRIFLGFFFTLFFITFIFDMALFTLNGMHINHGVTMLFSGGVGNFTKNLAFTKLSWLELNLYLTAIVFAFLLCWIFIWYCETRLKKHTIKTNLLSLLASSLVIFVLVFTTQKYFYSNLTPNKLDTLETNHVLYIPMVSQKNYILEFDISTQALTRFDKRLDDATIVNSTSTIENIYIFIFESLREDIVDTQTMPFLSNFKKNSWQFKRAISSGNATHYGWYAIINGNNPYYWERYNNLKDKMGSPALQLFKKSGYKINIYTAKDLSYLNSNKIMFSEDLSIVDYISDHPNLTPPEHDKRVITQLLNDLESHEKEKNINLIFLDSSHYPYKWLDGEIDELKPYIGTPNKGVNLSKAKKLVKEDKQQIYNRYRNSNKFSDKLFGQVVEAINNSKLNNKSLIVAVGDHGQQFLEHGYLLHGFTLNSEDIHVPLYFQGVNVKPKLDQQTVTHLDIMPTLFDLSGIKVNKRLFDGVSMLKGANKYGLSAAAGMQNTPYSFIVENEKYKLTFRIEKNNPANSKKLFVDSIYNQDGTTFVPKKGNKADYIDFISKEFPGFPQSLNFIKGK